MKTEGDGAPNKLSKVPSKGKAHLEITSLGGLSSIITRTPASRTFPPALFEFTGQFVSDWRGMTAMSVLMLIPAVIFVALIQRQLLEGLTSGATKG
jgi:ABC-type maltose transport system permease subunit